MSKCKTIINKQKHGRRIETNQKTGKENAKKTIEIRIQK